MYPYIYCEDGKETLNKSFIGDWSEFFYWFLIYKNHRNNTYSATSQGGCYGIISHHGGI